MENPRVAEVIRWLKKQPPDDYVYSFIENGAMILRVSNGHLFQPTDPYYRKRDFILQEMSHE